MIKNLPRSFPSIFSVNLLYLVILVLNIFLGGFLQSQHFIWGLIASEVLVILLPTIAFLRMRRIPLKEGLRLKPIRPLTGLLCILLGFTTYLFIIVLDAIVVRFSGLPVLPLSAEMMPKGLLEMIGLFLAMAVVAPVCEEPLFRGVTQWTYEKHRTSLVAITIPALMFAFVHLQLTGLVGLLPVAFILGYLAWHTRSIYASMLMHFGLNAPSAIQTLLSLNSGKGLPFLGLPAAAIGLVATVVLIYLINRQQPKVEEQPVVEEQTTHPEQGKPRSWFWDFTYSPLAMAGLIFMWATWQTLSNAQITLSQAGYDKVHIDQVFESRFRITNQAGNEVGGMNCTITPQGSNIRLDCAGNVRAYEVTTSSGNFEDDDHTISWSATWDTNTMGLLDFTYTRTYTEVEKNIRAAVKDGRLMVENSTGAREIYLSPDDLVEYEWAWRAQSLKPQIATSIQAPFAYLFWRDEQAGNSYPLLRNEILHLFKTEPLNIPAGQFQAHKASLGGQVTWFANGHPGPVRIEDGMLIYDLEK